MHSLHSRLMACLYRVLSALLGWQQHGWVYVPAEVWASAS